MSIILFLSFGSFYTHAENKRRVDIDWFCSLASTASTWGRPRGRVPPNGRHSYGGHALWFGWRRVYRSISSQEKLALLSNAFVPSPRSQRRPSIYERAAAVRSWPSFCEYQQQRHRIPGNISIHFFSFILVWNAPAIFSVHDLGFEVVWGRFSCLENVTVVLDFRADFIVFNRCLSGLESSSIPFEAIAAYTLGIASFWGCLRRTRSLAGGWKFQWMAAESSFEQRL